MDSTADRHRPILITSFAFELMIVRRLVAAAHALDKRDRKTVSALEVGTPRYSNLSQLLTRSPFAKRTCLKETCPWCIALALLWLIARPISAAKHSSRSFDYVNCFGQKTDIISVCENADMDSGMPAAIPFTDYKTNIVRQCLLQCIVQ